MYRLDKLKLNCNFIKKKKYRLFVAVPILVAINKIDKPGVNIVGMPIFYIYVLTDYIAEGAFICINQSIQPLEVYVLYTMYQ